MHASTWQRIPLRRQGCQRADRVDDAMRVRRRGADDQHGRLVDGGGGRGDVGAEVSADGHHPS
jgi:hypothetical protein